MIEEVPELKALSPTQFQAKLWEVANPATGRTYVRHLEDLYAAQHGYQPVVDRFDIPIEWGDIRTLRRSSQGVFCIVNDEIINFYMKLLADRSKGKKYHFFNSFFIARFMDKTYDRSKILRWTKSKNIGGASIFGLEKLFIPINLANVHWALIVVFPQSRKVRPIIALRLLLCCLSIYYPPVMQVVYYDSLPSGRDSNASKYCAVVIEWLQLEAKAKLNTSLEQLAPGCEWECVVDRDVTDQANAHACGVHLCMNADLIASGIELRGAYTSGDTDFFRRKIACDIFRGRLAYDL
jgi:sentrin-specific protease 1